MVGRGRFSDGVTQEVAVARKLAGQKVSKQRLTFLPKLWGVCLRTTILLS